MAIKNNNARDDVLTTFRDQISQDFKRDEVLHVYDSHKNDSLSSWGLAVEKGHATGNTAHNPKGIFMCVLIVRTITKAQTIINSMEQKQKKKLDFPECRDIIYDQYETILNSEAMQFASVNRFK